MKKSILKLAVFLKETYGSTMIAALKTVLPVKREVKAKEKKTIVRQMTGEEIRSLLAESIRKHQTGKTRLSYLILFLIYDGSQQV